MRYILLLSALVVMVVADGCTPMQRLKVKGQWRHVYGTDRKRIDAGYILWRAVFSQAPQARDLFKRVHGDDLHSPEFKAHSARVLGGLDIAISLLDTPVNLNAALSHLREQHIDRSIPGSYFDVFKHALMVYVPSALGRCFDEEAWSSCFDVIADGIKA